jgi:hypothetical protein
MIRNSFDYWIIFQVLNIFMQSVSSSVSFYNVRHVTSSLKGSITVKCVSRELLRDYKLRHTSLNFVTDRFSWIRSANFVRATGTVSAFESESGF